MNLSFYQPGDEPNNWAKCPLGRICKANKLPRGNINAAKILKTTVAWVDGYVNGFDGSLYQSGYSDRKNYAKGYSCGILDWKRYCQYKLRTTIFFNPGKWLK